MKIFAIKYAKAVLVFLLALPFFYFLIFNYKGESFSPSAFALSMVFSALVLQVFFYNPLFAVSVFSRDSHNLMSLKPFLRKRVSFEFLTLSASEADKFKGLVKLDAGFYKYGTHELYLNNVQNSDGVISAEFQFKSFEASASGFLYLFKGRVLTTPLYFTFLPSDKKPKTSLGWRSVKDSSWLCKIPGSWMRLFGLDVCSQIRRKWIVHALEERFPQSANGISFTSIGHDRLLLIQRPTPLNGAELSRALEFE
jgi:hypothetical protein